MPEGKINTTDPDSGVMIQKGQPPMQGYNAQAAITTNQFIVTAEVTTTAPDYGQLRPVVDAALPDLRQAGIPETPTTVLADTGYWHTQQMERIVADGMRVLIPPDSGLREDARPGWEGGFYAFMRRVLHSDHGRARRGRAAVRSEWRLIAASHNLLKLHSHWIQPATG